MAAHYRTQGIILKKIERNEADQLFTIYTKNFGKLTILGKAIRKIKSKLRPGSELFYLSEIEFIQGRTHKTLTDAILIEKFPNLRKDLERLAMACKISEVLDELVKDQEPDEKTWVLLNEVFYKLNNWEIENSLKSLKLKIIYYYFLWNFLSILGYEPELYNCSICQKHLKPEKLFFSPKEGGIVCNDCKTNKTPISSNIVKILRILLKKDWAFLLKLKIEKQDLKFLNIISNKYYSYLSA